MISKFPSISNSGVAVGDISFKELISLIRNPGKYKEQIILARIFHQYGDLSLYNTIKRTKLPAFTINCSFHKRRGYKDIKAFSGYIYLDVDNEVNINLEHPLIHASWRSLSNTGRVVVVRVTGVNITNFKHVYQLIGNELNLNLDKYAAKANQLNVLSFDPILYYNPTSKIYHVPENIENQDGNTVDKNVLHSSHIKTEQIIGTAATLEPNFTIRFNNIDEYIKTIDFDGEAAIISIEEVGLSEVKIPSPILEGNRNRILAGICFQIKSLNHHISFRILYKIIFWISKKHCKPPYPKKEIYQLVKSIHRLPKAVLTPRVNVWRRVFYNPDYDLTATEKRSLSRKLLNAERTEKIIDKIGKVIYEWNNQTQGKLTRKAISEKAGVSYSSAKKYYPLFEDYIEKNIKKIKPP